MSDMAGTTQKTHKRHMNVLVRTYEAYIIITVKNILESPLIIAGKKRSILLLFFLSKIK